MIGSDHAERIKAVASNKTSFNLGGDLAFILTRKILLRTKDRLDLGLETSASRSAQEVVMEERRASSGGGLGRWRKTRCSHSREGYDRTPIR